MNDKLAVSSRDNVLLYSFLKNISYKSKSSNIPNLPYDTVLYSCVFIAVLYDASYFVGVYVVQSSHHITMIFGTIAYENTINQGARMNLHVYKYPKSNWDINSNNLVETSFSPWFFFFFPGQPA